MKVLQLNARYFKMEEEILAFLHTHQPDIILLQEVSDGIMSRGVSQYPLERIAQECGYQSAHGKSYSTYNDQKQYGSFGVAVLSKYPIIEQQVHYVPYLGGYREYAADEVGLDKRGNENTWKERLAIWTFEWQTPSPIVDVQLAVGDQTIRVMSTHFKPSQQCTESFQMLKHAQYLHELLGFHTELPTILGGDFNIGRDAIVLQGLYDQMEHVLPEAINTLNPRIHPGFQGDIPPTGYHVDHILHKGFATQHAEVMSQVDITDHFPILAQLELTNLVDK